MYGNVFNSRGSVIPLFRNLISKNKKSLPITHEKMTRFFISVENGVKFVLTSFKRMHGGEIFVPKLPSVFIKDIVKAFDPKLKYHIIGIRPGEKLHEVLCVKEESYLTIEFKNHYIIEPLVWNVKSYMIDKNGVKGKRVKKDFEYNSFINKNFLSVKNISKILKKLKP